MDDAVVITMIKTRFEAAKQVGNTTEVVLMREVLKRLEQLQRLNEQNKG